MGEEEEKARGAPKEERREDEGAKSPESGPMGTDHEHGHSGPMGTEDKHEEEAGHEEAVVERVPRTSLRCSRPVTIAFAITCMGSVAVCCDAFSNTRLIRRQDG